MLQDILTKYKSDFICHTELRAQSNTTFTLELSNEGKITRNIISKSGVSARVFEKGAYGFAAASIYDDESVKKILSKAKLNARTIGNYRKNTLIDIPYTKNGIIPINCEAKKFDIPLLISVAEELKIYAENKYPGITASINMVNRCSEKLIVVYNGMDGRSNIVLDGITVSLETKNKNNEVVSEFAAYTPNIYVTDAVADKDRLYKLVDEAYIKLEKKIEEESIEKVMADGGTWDCILSPEFTGLLAHEAVGHTCEADAVVAKDSVAHKYMNQQVASPLVSLTDFAHTAYGEKCPINLYIDDEGTECKNAVIIKDGILVGCMNDRLTAQQLGIEPTGNARASNFYDEPIIRMRNTCFLPGTSKLEDMIASIEKGYYLTKCGGGNGNLKGEFNMITSKGYEIINGKLGRTIQDTITAGIAWEALKTVDMVSSNFENTKMCGTCGKKQFIPTSDGGPEMKLKLTLGGK